MPTDDNRHHQTPQDTDRWCLSMSGGVGLRLLLSVVHWSIWKYLWDVCWVSVVYRWVVWGIWVAFREIWGIWMCLGGIWVLIPCSMELKDYFGTAPKVRLFSMWPLISFPKIIKAIGRVISKEELCVNTVILSAKLEENPSASKPGMHGVGQG